MREGDEFLGAVVVVAGYAGKGIIRPAGVAHKFRDAGWQVGDEAAQKLYGGAVTIEAGVKVIGMRDGHTDPLVKQVCLLRGWNSQVTLGGVM